MLSYLRLSSLSAIACALVLTSSLTRTLSPVHAFAPLSTSTNTRMTAKTTVTSLKVSYIDPEEVKAYPEKYPATYDLQGGLPFEFGDAAFVRPLLKQTQLEKRKLQVVYDAKKHGFDAKAFHAKVDGKGAAVVLAKSRGQWFGGYNPRGWASLGGSRPSVASFVFYKKFPFGWQKLRTNGGGGMACSRDEFDQGIYFGADSLVMPLNGVDPRSVASRLGMYFEGGPEDRSTLLPRGGGNYKLDELKVLTGIYAKGEDIPNSGGVLDLGLY